jgi:hypothetical protein
VPCRKIFSTGLFKTSPAGVISNFAYPEDHHGHMIQWTAEICLLIILIFISVRLYAKVFVLQWNSSNDCNGAFLFLFAVLFSDQIMIAERRYKLHHSSLVLRIAFCCCLFN